MEHYTDRHPGGVYKLDAALAEFANRHPSTLALLRFFAFEHLTPALREISEQCCDLAIAMVRSLADGPELTTGLRKLLEAKDCFVRSAL